MISIEQARSGGGETRALSGSASLHCLTRFTHGFFDRNLVSWPRQQAGEWRSSPKWWFPSMEVPKNGWLMMENPIGHPYFGKPMEASKYGNFGSDPSPLQLSEAYS